MAVDTLGTFTQDEIEYIRQTALIMGELDWNTGINDAKKEGFTKGLIKGRNEGLTKGRNKGLIEGRNEANLENAQKMKAMGFLMEQIQAVTGLSTDTIARL